MGDDEEGCEAVGREVTHVMYMPTRHCLVICDRQGVTCGGQFS